jgi:hypothetical protein
LFYRSLRDDAHYVLSKFTWGHSFFELNQFRFSFSLSFLFSFLLIIFFCCSVSCFVRGIRELLDAYSVVTTPAEVRATEQTMLDVWRSRPHRSEVEGDEEQEEGDEDKEEEEVSEKSEEGDEDGE